MQILGPDFCRLVQLKNALKIFQSLEKYQSVLKVLMGFTKVSMMYVVALFTAIYFEIISPIVRRLVENTIQTRCYPNLVSPIRSCLFKRL